VIYMDESCLSRWELDYQEKCCRVCMRHVFLRESGCLRIGAVMHMKESCLSGWEREYEDTSFMYRKCALRRRAPYI